MVNMTEAEVRAHEERLKKGKQAPKPPTPGVSTDEAKLNKTERDYLRILRMLNPHEWVGIQCITLKLAHDTRYTPDFWTVCKDTATFDAWEVKGFMRDDARVKLFTAARLFPTITFHLVRRERHGWTSEIVKP